MSEQRHHYAEAAADISDATPETDAVEKEFGSDCPAMTALARRLERERDEARWHADCDVVSSIECCSTSPNKDGWRMDCEADEYELRYAAKRGLIERHPKRPTWLRIVEVPAQGDSSK